jgi:pseudo-rSAM protein
LPKYNGNNLSFFEENVFIEKEDLLNQKLSIKKIQTNRIINQLFFGKLDITHDGFLIQKNMLNTTDIRIDDQHDLMYFILHKLSDDHSNWFLIRKKCEPCVDCIYNEICPPVSYIEMILGRNNLCHFNVVENKWKGE